MNRPLRLVFAAVLGLVAAFVVACGDSNGLLSSSQASGLDKSLDGVASAVQNGDCSAASSAVGNLKDRVSALPTTVDPRLRAQLGRGAVTVGELAAHDCAQGKTSPSTSTSKSAPPPSSTRSTTTPPSTTTAPPSTHTTPPGPTETTPPPPGTSPGGGKGNGGGGPGPGGGAPPGHGNGNGSSK